MIEHWVTSGDAEIDETHRAVASSLTDKVNFPHRLAILTTWMHLLQRQGADLSGYAPHFDQLKASRHAGDEAALSAAVADAYAFLAAIQRALVTAAPRCFTNETAPLPTGVPTASWAVYGGNPHHTASTDEPGPQRGTVAWKQPIGLAWTARPTVEQDRVYVAVPGLRTFLHCLDFDTGALLWQTRRPWTQASLGIVNLSPSSYVLAGAASTPVVLADSVIVNQLGAQGRDFGARNLLVIDKATGQITRQLPAGQADYRLGHAALAGSDLLVYPSGTQRIKDRPPQIIAQNRIVCANPVSGATLWDFHVGQTFSDPVVDDGQVIVGTADGMVFCLNLSGAAADDYFGFSDVSRVVWTFKAQGAVNSAAAVSAERVYFGDNAGWFTCLDRQTGALIWQTEIATKEDRSFRLFSKPVSAEGRVYVGTSARQLICFDGDSGQMIWSYDAPDWVRASPQVDQRRIFFASVDGSVGCLEDQDNTVAVVWLTKVGTHPIYADLVESGGKLLINASDLKLWCLDSATGTVRWQHALLDQARVGDHVYAADELACGGWYQSKPTAAEGKVFIGGPSHFVFALDARTGAEVWRFEVGGAISAAPAYADGKVFFGQQGGEEDFYCLDATTGSLLWKQAVGWVWSSANVADGRVFVPGVDGYVSALDADSGHMIWRYRTGSSTAPEPPVDNQRVFFGSWDHYVYALDAASGKLLWQFHTGGTPDSGAPIAFADKLYIPMGGKRLCCLDARTGQLLWDYRLAEGDMNASPALWRGRLYISTGLRPGAIPIASSIQCLDAVAGTKIWEFAGGGGITGPAVADGNVYFASTSDPFFTCVDAIGNGDGTTNALWRCDIGERVYESVPALYAGRAFILSESGYLFAFD